MHLKANKISCSYNVCIMDDYIINSFYFNIKVQCYSVTSLICVIYIHNHVHTVVLDHCFVILQHGLELMHILICLVPNVILSLYIAIKATGQCSDHEHINNTQQKKTKLSVYIMLLLKTHLSKQTWEFIVDK